MLKVYKTVDESFAINEGNGWHKKERTFAELMGLIHTELSEAFEDLRNGHAPAYEFYEFKNPDGTISVLDGRKWDDPNQPAPCHWKPCGIPSELADVIIRIADTAGIYKRAENLDNMVDQVRSQYEKAGYVGPMGFDPADSFGTALAKLHYAVAQATAAMNEDSRWFWLAICWVDTENLAALHAIELERAITEKLAHNATRGERHGGKEL